MWLGKSPLSSYCVALFDPSPESSLHDAPKIGKMKDEGEDGLGTRYERGVTNFCSYSIGYLVIVSYDYREV